MDNDICFIITLCNGDQLLRCALKIKGKQATDPQLREYYMEPENRARIKAMLPSHVQSFGSIVDIDELFEVAIVGDK